MTGANATPWFSADKATLGQALQSQAQILENSPYESTRRQNLLYDAELYAGCKLSSLYQLNGDSFERLWGNPTDIAFNVCYSTVNTIRNRICSFRPRAQFIPNGGDHKAERAARDRTEMSDAWAEKYNYQAEASYAFRDILTGDGGVLKVYVDGDKIIPARFPAWEFYFDEAESIYGEPECAYHVHYMPIEQAAAKYNVTEAQLKAYSVSQPMGFVYVTNRELVRIVEAWQRGPGEEYQTADAKTAETEGGDTVKPGRHVVVCGDQIVTDEPWWFDGFPLIVKKFDERFVGVWGDGAVRRLRALQLELIEWQAAMREAHRLTSQQVVLLQEGEDADTKVTNAYVRIQRYRNAKPEIVNPPAVNPEMYQYYRLIKEAAYETLGINQSVAQGQKQPGVDSAIGIRESTELVTDRLSLLSQLWEDMRVEAADWWWRFTKMLATRKENPVYPKWRAVSRGMWREVTAKDFDQENEIRRFPSSIFGQTVSGKFQRATELIKGGFMSKDDALKALDIPDLAPLVDLALAQAYAMETLVDGILEDGAYETPDPQIDPVAMHEYARNRYLLAIATEKNYPAENMALMRRLLEYVKPLADKAKATQQPAAPAPGGAPPAAGASPEQIQAQGAPGQMQAAA